MVADVRNSYNTGLQYIYPVIMVSTGKVARKRALYPPKHVMEELGLNEGQLVKYKIEDRKLVVEPVRNPIELALTSRKWAKTTVKEFESESEREQRELYG